MTRRGNARLAGIAFLYYIAAGILDMVLSNRATAGADIAARLASVAGHQTELRVVVVLSLSMAFAALVLGVTLWAITRDQDPDLAMLGLTCRAAEGVIGGVGITQTLGLIRLATGTDLPDPGAARTLGAFLFRGDVAVTATFFAVGSTLFSWLLLRGRMIPVPLAWLGVLASVLLVVLLPLEAAGFVWGCG
jgi:hypothetical protein